MGEVLAFEPFEGDKGAPLDLRRLRNKIVTAAKPHKCHDCPNGIEAGERHRVLVEVARGEGLMEFRWCQVCMREQGRSLLGVSDCG